jgi:hypothetical protein
MTDKETFEVALKSYVSLTCEVCVANPEDVWSMVREIAATWAEVKMVHT